MKLKFGVDYKKYDFVSFEVAPRLGNHRAGIAGRHDGRGPEHARSRASAPGSTCPRARPRPGSIPDLDAFARTFDIYSNTGMFALGSITNAAARGNNRSVTEQDHGAYLQARLLVRLGNSGAR